MYKRPKTEIAEYFHSHQWSVEEISQYMELSTDQVVDLLVRKGIRAKKKGTHKYPKTRKLTIRKNTFKAYLLERYPLKRIKEVWEQHGMYKGAKILNTNPGILYYLATLKKWVKPLPPHLLKAYKNGNWNRFKTCIKPELS
ncbi:MAG: hypothetical protein GY861_20300 [bacterium]|nr:hypothetical protein [bacterium]